MDRKLCQAIRSVSLLVGSHKKKLVKDGSLSNLIFI